MPTEQHQLLSNKMIIVDTREHFIPIIKDMLVTSIMGDEVPEFQFHCLPLGDYLLSDNDCTYLIERKSISDFCGSYGVLKPRLAKMRKTEYERTGLLLEGHYLVSDGQVFVQEGTVMKPRMKYKTMCNFLTHQQELGTKVFYTNSLEESIWKLIHIHNYMAKLDSPQPCIKAGSVQEWLSELPGIGSSKIKSYQDKYISPLDALNNLPPTSKKYIEKW